MNFILKICLASLLALSVSFGVDAPKADFSSKDIKFGKISVPILIKVPVNLDKVPKPQTGAILKYTLTCKLYKDIRGDNLLREKKVIIDDSDKHNIDEVIQVAFTNLSQNEALKAKMVKCSIGLIDVRVHREMDINRYIQYVWPPIKRKNLTGGKPIPANMQ